MSVIPNMITNIRDLARFLRNGSDVKEALC